jgi:lipopolysaccharide biosynthesis regulator YciM
MKGRTGGASAGRTQAQVAEELKHGTHGLRQRSLNGPRSVFQCHQQPARVVVAVAALTIAILLGALLVSYGSKLYQNWRENGLLGRATALLQQGKLSGAAQMARELLARHPDSLPALSILANTAERQNLEEAVLWRERIARLRPTDPESQLNFASAALRFGKLDVAREALTRVSQKDRDSAAFHVVAGWLALAEGNFAEQEEQFAAAVKKEPNNDLYQFNLAALQIRSKDAEKSNNARDTLERLSKIVRYRTGALRALLNAAVDRNDLTSADNFAQQLQMSPDVTFGDYLLCLNFYRKLNEKKFRRLLERVKPFAARNPADVGALIDWMNQNGLAADVVEWIDKLPPAQLSSPPVSVAVADAYATGKNWSRLKRFTRTGNWGDADNLRLAFQAIAVQHLRSGSGSSATSEFKKLWQGAYDLSKNDSQRQLTLARLATKWQLESQAEEVWLAIEKNPSMRREALNNLRRIDRANGETTKLYEVLERLHEISPDEVPITADLARLGLNLEQNIERSHQLAKEAYDRAPNDINCAVTYAFSLYRLGKNSEALDIIQSLSPDQLHDPRAAVYTALVLIEAGQLDAAKEYIGAAEDDTIYPEEKTLLDEAKAKLLAAPTNPSPGESPAFPATNATPPLWSPSHK